MNMEFKRKMPSPQEVKDMYSVTEEMTARKKQNDKEIRDVFTGKDNRLVLVIGPCSADREDAVLDYISRLREVQEKVKDKILIIPRQQAEDNGRRLQGNASSARPQRLARYAQGAYRHTQAAS